MEKMVQHPAKASAMDRLRGRLERPVDGASLAAFRIAFGLIAAFAMVRAIYLGWVEQFYAIPRMHLTFWGFGWVEPLPVAGMYVLYGALALCGLGIALGLFTRLSALLFAIGFTYIELIDVTNYLNHYYFLGLVALLLAIVPAHRMWSLDARRRSAMRSPVVPTWALYLIRLQVGTVYFFAGLAKLGSDWLLHAQPLGIWLSARTDTPILGPLFGEPAVAYAFSWAGFLFDTTIVLWLSLPKTRTYAYLVVLSFHGMTSVLFDIGLFPLIMIASATIFFDPGWPRRLLGRLPGRRSQRLRRREEAAHSGARFRLPAWGLAAGLLYAALQVGVPLRHFAYPGDVLWTEEGMRFSWKVMVREKHGSIRYRVAFLDSGKELEVSAQKYLTPQQEREMSGQPDLIQQLARHIRSDFERRYGERVAVHVDAWVSLNGRAKARMIDPAVDLSRADDGLGHKSWLLPPPAADPLPVRRARRPLSERAAIVGERIEP